MRLETAELDRYGPLTGCHPPCESEITVLAGPNESGKTLYLEGLLQLLDPGVAAAMQPEPRVDGSPTGRVVLDDGGERHDLGDGTALSDVSRIDPVHLYTLFVIRDSDLALPEGTDYYTSLVERLGDIHTSAIEAMREQLVEEGLLTPTSLNLRDRGHKTKTVRNSAEQLAEDVEDYLETAESEDVEATVRQRLQTRRELSSVHERLEIQQTAKEVAALEDARSQLQRYEDATESLADLTAFERETLEDVRERKQDIAHLEDRIDELESELQAARDEAEQLRADRREARDRRDDLQQREDDVERAEEALEEYRETESGATGESVESSLAQRRWVAIAGLVGGGIAAGGGAIAGSGLALLLGAVLLVVAAGAGISHRRLVRRQADLEARETELLQAARDAGFEVETAEDVGPRIRRYRGDLQRARDRVQSLSAQLDAATDRVDGLESDLEEKREEREDCREALSGTLAAADVDSVDEYDAGVDERDARARQRSEAEPVLERLLGEPDADEPTEKIRHWRSELEEVDEEIGDVDVDADRYDEAELARLESEREEFEARLATLEDELEAFGERLDEFERRANEPSPPPVAETDPVLEARTTDGLRDLAASVRDLVAEIETNADVSRKAIGILDEIRADEEQKVSTLFDPEGPASRYLERLTDGRYEAVDYDPAAERLEVTAADGRIVTPHQLSRGTKDQLYFAARLSLAGQLLDGGSGFLLLDDPFLTADPDRLHNGFEILRDLTADGWQILYLTAKPEVHDEMAAAFDCEVYELETVDH